MFLEADVEDLCFYRRRTENPRQRLFHLTGTIQSFVHIVRREDDNLERMMTSVDDQERRASGRLSLRIVGPGDNRQTVITP